MTGRGSGLALVALGLAGLPLFGQIDGTVINATNGKPQAGVTVNLIHPGANGMETLGTATSAADGTFKIAKDLPSPPALLRATYQDVEYNQVVPPGTPSTGIKLSVYDATNKTSASFAQQHLTVVEPGTDGIRMSETFLLQNAGTTTFLDPVKGSIQFYLPKSAQGNTKVTINAPNGMPISRPPEKTSQADVFKIGYPVKPGQTEYDVAYMLPAGSKFGEKKLAAGPDLMVTAESVKLSGPDLKDDGVKQLGQGGPRARVYEITAKQDALYEVTVEGTGALQSAQDSGQPEEEEEGGSPKPKAGQARIYERLPWVLGLAFGILAVGGTLLFRRSSPAA